MSQPRPEHQRRVARGRATIYLGDTNQVFGLDSWGNIEGDWGQARLWMRHADSNLTGGAAGPWGGYVNQDHNAVTSVQFTATGTWYWGIQMTMKDLRTNWYSAGSAA